MPDVGPVASQSSHAIAVVGIGGVPDFDVSFDGYTRYVEQIYQARLIIPPFDLSEKHPIPAANCAEILLLYPLSRFARMPPNRPSPDDVDCLVCYFAKYSFADDVAMVVGPPP